MTQAREPILVFGAGGHSHSVIDTLRAEGRYEILGLIDSQSKPGLEVYGLTVLGTEAELPALLSGYNCRSLCIAIGDNYQRSTIHQRLAENLPDVQFVTTIHPGAVVSPGALLGRGVVVMAGAVINAGVEVGEGCLVNTRSSVDHDCILGAFSSVAPGATLGGAVRIGSRTSIGLGCNVRHRVCIGTDSVIGVGACVVRDIPDDVVAYGCPCVVVRSRQPDAPYL